jgi:signal transduction histidine kinase
MRPWTGRAAWRTALVAAAFSVVVGVPLVAAAAMSDHLEHPVPAAVLRAAWIAPYAAVGLWFARMRTHRGLGLTMTLAAALSAVAATDVLAGSGAYTVSRAVILALPSTLLLLLIAIPAARTVGARLTPVLLLSIPLVVVLGAAYLMVADEAPWSQAASECAGACAGSAIQVADAPALAHGLVAAIAMTLIGAMGLTVAALVVAIRRAGPVTARVLRPVGWLAALWAGPLAVGLVTIAIDPTLPGGLGPFLVTTSIIRAVLPFALVGVVLGRAARTAAMRDALATRLARVDDPTAVERVISDVLGDPSLRLAFRDGDGWIDVEGRPLAADGEQGWAFLDGAEHTALVFDPALEAQETRMRAAAGLGAAALERTRTEAELRALRRRLVNVAEDERKRIERNLHDGAQQRLISMAMRVALARETLASRPELALPLLQEFGADVQRTLDELRELAQGMYPSVLADHGLAEALRSLARRSPIPVDAAVAEVGRFAILTEAAVYVCCAEALQNAAKHAGPGAIIDLRLRMDDGDLLFEVADDGPGFATGGPTPGTGLTGMRDRVGAVGGTLEITSAAGAGTRVRGRVPRDAPPAGVSDGRSP